MFKRIFLIVCDSMGIGNAIDAKEFNDENSNTLKHISDNYKLNITNLTKLGLGIIDNLSNIIEKPFSLGYCLRLNEISASKDTLTGHWEMMGLNSNTPMKTFTDEGFPKEFIEEFENRTHRKTIGNIACSGTKILDMYGEHQIRTGDWIVYTSADSVFQIAANEDIIPLEELYNACEIAREMANRPEYRVGRIIARPYKGTKVGEFVRTSNRHDYALKPFKKTILDALKDNNKDVIAIGKINDIFSSQGITKSIHTVSNLDGMNKTIDLTNQDFNGLVFTNLVDFDSLYGHRRDPIGYGKAIDEFDKQLAVLISKLKNDDLLMITADHGNDPTFKGTDHTREQVPLLVYSKQMINHKQLSDMNGFMTIGKTIVENFKIVYNCESDSILDQLV
ncbi:MAG: phosphopentomutase [Thomasclavelia sp.]|nr:phosphopentomutase [Thomasclavelia sp.]